MWRATALVCNKPLWACAIRNLIRLYNKQAQRAGYQACLFGSDSTACLSDEFMYHFNLFYCGISCIHRFKTQCVADYPFQFAMIAFDNIIPVLNLSMFNVRLTLSFTFKSGDCQSICRIFIRIGNTWDMSLFYII